MQGLARRCRNHLIAHCSPLGWEHINLTADYVWSSGDEMTANRNGFGPSGPPRPNAAGGVSSGFVRSCLLPGHSFLLSKLIMSTGVDANTN